MFENEIKFINDFALNKTKDLGSLFTIEQLLSSDLHPCIKRYVGSEINFLIHKDRKNLIENSLFDYSGAKISNYFNLIADEIKKTKKVSFEDVKNIILQAVSFNANFVMRPKWALAKLIFGNNKSVSVNDIQMLLNYTYYYEYLNNVFLAYLTKKKILNISLTEFELIMNKIDRELFTLHQSKLVDNALYAIADFYSIGGLNKSSITVEAVEVFLKEKNLTELLFKLKRGFPNPTRKKIDIDDIRKVLYSEFPLDASLIGEKEQEEVRDDIHFENPLKEVIPPSTEEVIEPETPESESKIDEVFEEELSTIESGGGPEEKTPDVNVESENLTYESFDLSSIESRSDEVFSEEIELTSNSQDEKISGSNEDEKMLDSFIKDVEKNEEEEIIIVDEKEGNLLDFFDNENEISIDDDEGIKIEDFKSEIENVGSEEKDELNFLEIPVEENQLETDEPTDGKIEFEHENGDEESNKPEENTETEKPHVLDKTNFEDIFSFLSAKEIDRIIKNLFNSDSEDFANTVEKMAACNSFEEANEILENTFQYARIKPHSKDATILTKAVTKYFSQGH